MTVMGTTRAGRLDLPVLIVCVLALFTAPTVMVTGAEDGLIVSELNIGFPESSFSTVNTSDARAAITVWIDTVGRNHGFSLVGGPRVFSTAEVMFEEIREDRLDLVIINAWDYLELEEEQLLRPIFIPSKGEAVLDHYLLLVRRDKEINSLAELRGADIALLDATGVHYARYWLDTLVMGQGLGRTMGFFNSVTMVEKVSSAVLPVFFGKFDACLVDRSGYETMQQMNPQVERQMMPLAVSPPLIETVICLHTHGIDYELEVTEALGELHIEPRGQQILMVFRVDVLAPFDPKHLESLSRLRKQYLEQIGAGDGL